MANNRYFKDLRGSSMVRTDNSDAKTKACYRWERATFQGKEKRNFIGNREAAKGFARLCFKVALKRLAAKHNLTAETVDKIRSRWSLRMAREHHRFSCAGTNGAFLCGWGWVDWVIAHEVAHFIDAKEAEFLHDRRAGHGMHWLGWYAFLLADVCGYENVGASLAAARLRFHAK